MVKVQLKKQKKGIENILQENIRDIGNPRSKQIGYRINAYFSGLNFEQIDLKEKLEVIIKEALEKSGLKVLNPDIFPYWKQFKPWGVTCIAGLEQSHLAIHTWPEYGYMDLDIYSCNGEGPAEMAYEIIKEKLKPKKVVKEVKKIFSEL